MRTDLFDFDLPDDRIALEPAHPRDAARLLVVTPSSPSPRASSPSPRAAPTAPQALTARGEGRGEGQERVESSEYGPAPHESLAAPHPNPLPATDGAPKDGTAPLLDDRHIRDLPGLLRPGDALVVNDTRVIRAALAGERIRGANRAVVSFNLHKRLDAHRWLAFARPAKRLAEGDRIRFRHDDNGVRPLAAPFGSSPDLSARGLTPSLLTPSLLEATVARIGAAGEVELAFSLHGADLDEAIEAVGDMPLPPYIATKRAVEPGDAEHYQTVFARREGAVAAPTAGLHFTDGLLAALAARGITRHTVTLHVGAGTFLPVKAEDTREHRMHSEWGEITPETAAALNGVRQAGGRLVAVGTTALRLLESAAADDGSIRPFAGETDIFITPGYRFKAVDLLLTNFHLPRSTLFMLVSAFSGLDTMHAAYAHAIETGYRFYSYGDACLLCPGSDPAGLTPWHQRWLRTGVRPAGSDPDNEGDA